MKSTRDGYNRPAAQQIRALAGHYSYHPFFSPSPIANLWIHDRSSFFMKDFNAHLHSGLSLIEFHYNFQYLILYNINIWLCMCTSF